MAHYASVCLRKQQLPKWESNPQLFAAAVFNVKSSFISLFFLRMSGDWPPACWLRPLWPWYLLAREHAAVDNRVFTSQNNAVMQRNVTMKINEKKKKKERGCLAGDRGARIRFPRALAGSQTSGRDLRQEGDSGRKANDSGTRQRKTSGSASWHLWWKRFSSAHKQPNEWLKS